MFATRVEAVAACFGRQRMNQHRAFVWLPRHDELLPHGEVLARLLFTPVGGSCGKGLQGRATVFVTGDTARVPRTLLEEDRLHLLFEERVVQGGLGLGLLSR